LTARGRRKRLWRVVTQAYAVGVNQQPSPIKAFEGMHDVDNFACRNAATTTRRLPFA